MMIKFAPNPHPCGRGVCFCLRLRNVLQLQTCAFLRPRGRATRVGWVSPTDVAGLSLRRRRSPSSPRAVSSPRPAAQTRGRGRKPSPQAGVWAGTKHAATSNSPPPGCAQLFAFSPSTFCPEFLSPGFSSASLTFCPAARGGPGLTGARGAGAAAAEREKGEGARRRGRRRRCGRRNWSKGTETGERPKRKATPRFAAVGIKFAPFPRRFSLWQLGADGHLHLHARTPREAPKLFFHPH